MEFDKKKTEKAIKAVEDMCLHCKNHSDGCPVVKISDELKELL